jgi:hypothetical protein
MRRRSARKWKPRLKMKRLRKRKILPWRMAKRKRKRKVRKMQRKMRRKRRKRNEREDGVDT